MVALSKKLIAATRTHQSMVQVVEARAGIGGAQREADGNSEQQSLREFQSTGEAPVCKRPGFEKGNRRSFDSPAMADFAQDDRLI